MDVQLTKDDVLVVIHDETIDRVTDGTGRVVDYTYEELKKFNAAKNFPEAGFHPVPTFDEYCAWAASVGMVTNIEIKTGHYYYEEIERKLVEMVRSHGLADKVLYSSFNHMSLAKIKELEPGAQCGALLSEAGDGQRGGITVTPRGFSGIIRDIRGLRSNWWTTAGSLALALTCGRLTPWTSWSSFSASV